MFRSNLFFSFMIFLFTIAAMLVISEIFMDQFALTFQLLFLFAASFMYIIHIWRKIRSSLTFLKHTMTQAGNMDATLTQEDMEIIGNITSITSFDIKKLIKFSNRLMLNQQTILKAALRDRDYIDKSKKLRDAIIALNKRIVAGENTDSLLQHLLSAAIEVIDDCDAGLIFQIEDDQEKLRLAAYSGFYFEQLDTFEFTLKNTFLFQLNKLQNQKPVIIRNKKEIDKKYHTPEEIKIMEKSGSYNYPSVLTAPISIEGNLYGIVSLQSKNKNGFMDDDIQLMEYFSSEMGIVLQNSILINKALYLSRFDSLTGVHNRHFFEDIAKLVFEDAHRNNRKIYLLLFDLDGFKSINDTYGHESGDLVLKTFAETVSNSIRGSDIFARYGGDEFIALFHDCDREGLKVRIQNIIDDLAATPVTLEGTDYRIKYSFGIAGFPEDGESYKEILKIADMNMYENKAENKK